MGQNVFSLTFLGGIWKRDEKGAINIFTKTFYLGEVPLNKLVPFQNYPIEKLDGKLLRDTKDELRNEKSYKPIIVRKIKPNLDIKDNDFYEILDGHYKVAAAKELGWSAIRAKSLGWLGDEEALRCIPDWDPVGLLYKHGFDIYSEDYRESAGYKNVAGNEIVIGNSQCGYYMSLDEYIKKYLLTKSAYESTYESKYTMGNPQDLDEEDCTYYQVALDIISVKHKCENAGKNMDGHDKNKDAVEILKETRDFVNRRIKRKDANFFIRIKKYLNLDLEQYDYTNFQNKRERAKILYFICTLELIHYPGKDVLQLLSKPSMENTDNLFWGWETSNGEIIRHIKTSIEEELSLKKIGKVQGKVSAIWERWNLIIHTARDEIELYSKNKSILSQVLSDIREIKKRTKHVSFPHQKSSESSPLEDLYLRILQLEYLGHVNDTLAILNMAETNTYEVPPKFWPKMRAFRVCPLEMEDLEWFFQQDNVVKIAKYVYLKDDITLEECRNIYRQDSKSNTKEKVLRFLKFWNFSNSPEARTAIDNISVLLVISCLQCIFLDDRNEIFRYTYHGFERENSTGKFHVQAALKKDESQYKHICDVEKLYWARKVLDRCYVNIGCGDGLQVIRDFEKLCCEIVKDIFNSDSLEEMEEKSNCYAKLID